jgi:hypothetical protein
MKFLEKLFSIFAILFAFSLITVLIIFPDYRQLKILLPLGFTGVLINFGLMFIVLRDIFLRNFPSSKKKYIWMFIVLFFWPTILYYLPRHGFKKRSADKT